MRHLFLALAGLSLGADWPQFRGAAGTGASAETGLPTKFGPNDGLAWKAELPGPGTSSPVFVGDRTFLTCYTGYNVPGKPRGEPADLRRHLLALDRKTGKVLWNTAVAARLPEQESIRDAHGYASSTPAADAERVYCFFGKSGAFAFDHSGKELWRADVGDKVHGWGSAASPTPHGDLVYINASVESETLFALDKKTGAEKWKLKGVRESWSTPTVVTNSDGKPELVLPMFGRVVGLDPRTGAERWTCKTDITWYMVPSVVAHEGVVYVIGGRSGVAALAVRTGGTGDVTRTHRLWTGKSGSNVSSPVFHNGHLYFMNDAAGSARCLKAGTGEVVYDQRASRADTTYASALLADGKLYYVGRTGRVWVVAAKPEFEELAANDLRDGGLFHATPVAADGRLFVRSDKFLYCFGK